MPIGKEPGYGAPEKAPENEKIPTPGHILEDAELASGRLQDFLGDLELELEELKNSSPESAFNGRLERGIGRAKIELRFLKSCLEKMQEK